MQRLCIEIQIPPIVQLAQYGLTEADDAQLLIQLGSPCSGGTILEWVHNRRT